MGYRLGIDLGTTYTAAATYRDGRVEIVTLGNRAASVPSVIFLHEDGTILTGDAANRRAITEPDRVAREFKRRVGDPTPMLLGGTPYSAEALTARLLRWTVDAVSQLEGGPPDEITLAHPANWGAYKQDLLRQAVRLADLNDVGIVTEPEAAAIFYASNARIEPGALVAVFDLGGGTFDAALLRKTADGWEILGQPEGVERLGGIDFDEAVFGHVRRALADEFDALDPDDPAVIGALARIRQDCIEAKEALSSDTEVSIPVLLPNVQTRVRLTRAEFEALVRPTLRETIQALRRALRSAGIEPSQVSAVLLVGGSSRVPLVAQLVGAELGRPVAVDAHPKHAVALGAALASAAEDPTRALPQVITVDAGTDVDRPAEGAPTVEEPIASPAASLAPEPAAAAPPGRGGAGGDAGMPSGRGADAGRRRGRLAAAGIGIVAVVAVLAVLLAGGGDTGDKTDDTATNGDATTGGDGSTRSTDEAAATNATVRITSIELRGERYVFTYETQGFTPIVDNPGAFHTHFFWDTVPALNAGSNGPDPGQWLLWDTPYTVDDPFFDVASRPRGARRICSLVATNAHGVADVDADGSVDTNTGNCVDLPDI